MHYLKRILIISFLFSFVAPAVSANAGLSACLDKGKKEFSAGDNSSARQTFKRCVSLSPKNIDALLSLAAVELKENQLEPARASFLSALKNMTRSCPYLSYTYSMLGDIAYKQGKYKEALAYYNRSLQYNEANVNSLVGKGTIIESQGDKKAAAQIYEVALAVEPLNIIARKHLRALEPIYFSDEQMLEAMKQRYAVMPDKQELSAEDKELFSKIHSAEQQEGVAYLKNKYPQLPAEYVVTLFKDTDFAREVLTLSGYNAMRKQVGQDAVAVFQKLNVRVQDIFDLRDMKGKKIFLDDTTLTDSGYLVYHAALNGKKTYLLPNEAVPPTKAFLAKVSNRVKELQSKGYTEISRPELAMIKKQTNCSEETLTKKLGLYVLPVTSNDKRYFVISADIQDDHKTIPWYFVSRSRSRRNPDIVPPNNRLVEMMASINQKVCSQYDGELM